MNFHVSIFIITFSFSVFANPLPPLDSVISEPYLTALDDHEFGTSTPRNPFTLDSIQTPSFSSEELNSILNSPYASTVDPSELVASTDLAAVPCKPDQMSGTFALQKGEYCNLEPPKGELGSPNKSPTGAGEPERGISPVPNTSSHPDEENECDPTTAFPEHYCCDGPIRQTTVFADRLCHYLIDFCIPRGSKMPLRITFLNYNNICAHRWTYTLRLHQRLLQ